MTENQSRVMTTGIFFFFFFFFEKPVANQKKDGDEGSEANVDHHNDTGH